MYKIGASNLLLMLFLMTTSSLLGLSLSTISNWIFISGNSLSYALTWLVTGAIILSCLSGTKKSKLLWSLMFMILIISFMASSIFVFYILFELSLIPMILMILSWGSQPERLSASTYFLMYTSIFSMPYILLILKMNFSFTFFYESNNSSLVSIILFFPFLVKMPIMGLHFWLPKAHVEASTSGSMILAGILLKLGSYGIYRITSLMKILNFLLTSSLWMILAIFASSITVLQTDLKKLVAYSSVTHMTFLMISLSINNKLFYFNCLILSLAHGWTSMGMFFSAGTISNNTNSRLAFIMSSESKLHWFSMILGILLITNAALPPFPSFFAELLMVTTSMSTNLIIFSFIVYSLLVCYYNTYLWMWVSHIKSSESTINYFTSSESSLFLTSVFLSMTTLSWMFTM